MNTITADLTTRTTQGLDTTDADLITTTTQGVETTDADLTTTTTQGIDKFVIHQLLCQYLELW
jgi:hypothetical protein